MNRRRPNRLRAYDYSQPGAYFVTVCAKDRQPFFSEIVGDGVLDAPKVRLSPWGQVVEGHIRGIHTAYPSVSIEAYVIMPNHVHLLIRVQEGPSGTPAPTGRANETIPRVVSTLKRFSNRDCGVSLFQRGYHDHVARGQGDYDRVWEYIHTNPDKWAEDCYYTE